VVGLNNNNSNNNYNSNNNRLVHKLINYKKKYKVLFACYNVLITRFAYRFLTKYSV